MMDISAMRTQSAGRVYPIKEIKDSYPYIRKTQYDPRVTNSASAAIRGDNTPRKLNDIRENFQQAALINIVASVNNEDELTSSSTEPGHSAINVLSNLFIQRERQISIPKPQMFLEIPQKFSKKKPIFNKKSGFQISDKEMENRKKGFILPRSRPISRDLSTPHKKERIKIAVSLQRNSEEQTSLDSPKDWITSPEKVKLARSNSPRHRFVALKKKPEPRVTTSIPTCEAVDILDATESIVHFPKQATIAPPREYTPSPSQDIYRAKSLPALFPVKRRKSSDSQSSATTEKKTNGTVNSANPFKRTSVKNYGGMPNLVLGKTIQTKTNDTVESNGETSKSDTKPSSASAENHVRLTHKDEKDKPKPIIINQENITLHGKSIPNPRPSSFQTQRYSNSKNPETDLLYDTLDQLDEKKYVLKNLDKQFEDLRKQISAKMSNLSDTSMLTESSSDIASYNLVGKAFKSSISTTSSNEKNGKQKPTKRVTFAENTEENIISQSEKSFNYDNDRALLNARLNQNRFQLKPKERTEQNQYRKQIKEVDNSKFNQKQMTGTVTQNKRNEIDNMRIAGLVPLANQVRSCSRASDTNRSMISEADTIMVEEAAREWNGEDVDVTNRDRTQIPISHGASSFYPNALDDDFDSDDSDDGYSGTMDSYRVLKAIDLGKLSNYQHRKLKNVPHKQEQPSTHFVKVKVK